MAKKKQDVASRSSGGFARHAATVVPAERAPKCVAVADAGIDTAKQFGGFMSALMGDVVTGRIAPQIANAACNAGGKLLKIVDMQHRYGKRSEDGQAEMPLLVR